MKTGYQGWWSLEVFNTSLEDKDGECPRRHGIRGLRGLNRLRKELEESSRMMHEIGQKRRWNFFAWSRIAFVQSSFRSVLAELGLLVALMFLYVVFQ
jgi:hypothetical protein